MLPKNPAASVRHISDEDLVRSADGELSSQRAAEVRTHLEACWNCRARMEEIQSTISDFVRAHHAAFDAQLPADDGPRALLRAQLTQLGYEPAEWWKRAFHFAFTVPGAAVACLPLIVMLGIFCFQHLPQRELKGAFVLNDADAAPIRNLTPGAARQITMTEVCSAPHEEVVGDVSASLRLKVLQEYGIAGARPDDYEIDYLIAPRLGGIDDIRNLWPQPNRARLWNAHVKDALEERLHEMVCDGELDLSTAQHDISSDWIAAYKKYFHTNKPLPLSS